MTGNGILNRLFRSMGGKTGTGAARMAASGHPPPVKPPPLSPEAFREAVARQGDRMPWFGAPPFAPGRKDTAAKNRVSGDMAAVRRVLLSLLQGGPRRTAASLAGCSERTLHNVLLSTVYAPSLWQQLPVWLALGLAGAADTPRGFTGDSADLRWTGPSGKTAELAVVYCLICHRYLGTIGLDNRRYNGEFVHPAPGRLKDIWAAKYTGGAVQAHLCRHFPIGADPFLAGSEAIREYLELYEETGHGIYLAAALAAEEKMGGARANRVRTTWKDRLHAETLYVLQETRSETAEDLAPVIGGKMVSIEEARRKWRKMLG